MSSTSATLAASRSRRYETLSARARIFAPLLTALLTLGVAWGALTLTHRTTRAPLAAGAALHHVMGNPSTASMLRLTHWRRMTLTPVDNRHELLGFFRGSRMVAVVIVGQGRHGLSFDASDLTREKYAYGSNIANDPRLLTILSVVFVLMTAVWPVWRIRNLDALACTSLVLSVVLLNRWQLGPLVLLSYPPLLYLAFRCAWWGMGWRRESAPSIPLFEHATRRWSDVQRLRTLRLLAVAAGTVVVIVGVTSLNILDVGYAVMEGATAIVHGLIPYGHVPGILHGDTYPLGSYLLYSPLAWLFPVRSTWDSAAVTLFVAAGAALVAAAALWRIASAPAVRASALRAVIAWFTFPPLLVTVSTGTTDVALAAMLVGALVLWRRPAWCAALLAAASWFKLVPLTIVPLLLARLRGRELARGTLAIGVVSAIMVGALLALGGWAAPREMAQALGYQFSRSSPHTLWTIVGSVPLQQLAEAATLSLIVGAVVRVYQDPGLGQDRRRCAGFAAAILLGVQISANYWNYMYLVWVFPFIAVALLRDTDPTPLNLTGAAGAPR
jgi:hypothetical protein